MNTFEAVIVGAGASGIAAAARLYSKGLKNIVILEAKNRIGGRIHSLRTAGDDGVIELGAQWVHGEENNLVYEMAEPRGYLTHADDFQNIQFVNSSGECMERALSDQLLLLCRKIMATAPVSIAPSTGHCYFSALNKELSKEDWSQQMDKKLRQQFVEWCHQFINSIDGSDSWYETGVTNHVDYKECEGDPIVAWKSPSSYSTVLALLIEEAGCENFQEAFVRLNHEVKQILWARQRDPCQCQQVEVRCANGQIFFAERVVVTIPLGVLKQKHQTLFEPSLPNINITAIYVSILTLLIIPRFVYVFLSDIAATIGLLIML